MNKKLCMGLTIAYHVLFLGGGTTVVNGYLEKIESLEKEIRTQGTKARKVVQDIDKTGQNINDSVSSLGQSVRDITKELDKVKKACGRIL